VTATTHGSAAAASTCWYGTHAWIMPAGDVSVITMSAPSAWRSRSSALPMAPAAWKTSSILPAAFTCTSGLDSAERSTAVRASAERCALAAVRSPSIRWTVPASFDGALSCASARENSADDERIAIVSSTNVESVREEERRRRAVIGRLRVTPINAGPRRRSRLPREARESIIAQVGGWRLTKKCDGRTTS